MRNNHEPPWLGIGLLCFTSLLLLCFLMTLWSVKKVRQDTRIAEGVERIAKAISHDCYASPFGGDDGAR